jgi:DNA-binding Lrp family transcriptional regulator
MPSAFVLVNCESDSAELFAADLRKMPGIKYAVRVSGVYEFYVKVNSDTAEELKENIMKIRTNNWVSSGSTFLVVKILM